MRVFSWLLATLGAFAVGTGGNQLAFAAGGINGAIVDVPGADIHHVVMTPEVTFPFIHHFMCVYIWDGQKWVVGTAGEVKDSTEELVKCQERLSVNTTNPPFVLSGPEYLKFESEYLDFILNTGLAAYACKAVGMITCPFTCGYGKPCYRENVQIQGILTTIIEKRASHPLQKVTTETAEVF